MIVHYLIVSLVALGAACCFAVSNVIEQRKASEAPADTSLRPALLWHLAHQPLWWLGVGVDVGGYGLQVVALGLGEVVFVQPLLVASLVLSLILGAMVGSHELSRGDLGWAALFVASLSIFLIAANPSEGVATRPFGAWVGVFVLVGVAVVGCVLVSRRPKRRALPLAAAAGMLFGVSSALTKSFADQITDRGFRLFGQWEVYALAGALSLGFLMMQSAFQAGDLRAALPAVEIAEPVLAGLLGVLLLRETLALNNSFTVVVLVIAIVAMVLSTIRLAQATAPEPIPSAPGRGTPGLTPNQDSEVVAQRADRDD